jgi:hypothetical protein
VSAPAPTAADRLLLRAALVPGPAAGAAWRTWAGLVDLDAVAPGAQRLLPLAYRNLVAAGVPAGALSRVAGVYRFHWTRNQVLLGELAAALDRLAQAGAAVGVAGGTAAALLDYPDRGCRPLPALDLETPDAPAPAAAVLERAGWRRAGGGRGLGAAHAAWRFRSPAGTALALHWPLAPRGAPRAGDALAEVAGRSVTAPGPLTRLRLALAPGSGSGAGLLAAIADAALAFRTGGAPGGPGPGGAPGTDLDARGRARLAWIERLLGGDPDAAGPWPADPAAGALRWYLAAARGAARAGGPGSVPGWLARLWGLPGARALPGAVARRAAGAVLDKLRG